MDNEKEKFMLINAGSSSLKFKLYDVKKQEVVSGIFERVGDPKSNYTIRFNGKKINKEVYIKDHTEAANTMIRELLENNIIDDINEISAVGHRVLLGGVRYTHPTLIDDELIKFVESKTDLLPLHHVPQLAAIRATQEVLPNTPMIAAFDNSFHHTMPDKNTHFSIPEKYFREYGIQRYGYHGISYQYITQKMQEYFDIDRVNLIICHLGSGSSVCQIKDGQSYNTSMGFTPLDGVVMGTRCGSVDASVLYYLIIKEVEKMMKLSGKKLSANDVLRKVKETFLQLNLESGLTGLAGKNDFRDITDLIALGNYEAIRAYEKLKESVESYIYAYHGNLRGEVDAIVFTAGIGENAIDLRADIADDISYTIKTKLDPKINSSIGGGNALKEGMISTPDSQIPMFVVPTNEEIKILEAVIDIYKTIKTREQKGTYQKKIGTR